MAATEADLDALAEVIAERVRRRLGAARVGAEEPCTPAPQGAAASAQALGPLGRAPAAMVGCHPEGCLSCEGEISCAPRQSVVSLGAARIGLNPNEIKTSSALAPYIDHTLLKPDATRDEVNKLCEEAKKYGFATVCVNASNVGYAARLLAGSGVVPIAVVGFPLGATTARAKAFEAREAIRAGAKEIDMVINIGALKSRDYRTVYEDIAAVVQAARPAPVKVILETSMLDQEQKIIACALAKAACAAFVKTSTGFGGGGATAEDIALMRRIVGPEMGVKASGGVRTAEDAMKMIAAGANRVGASASVAIVTGQAAGGGKY